jgi:hypothetical protein
MCMVCVCVCVGVTVCCLCVALSNMLGIDWEWRRAPSSLVNCAGRCERSACRLVCRARPHSSTRTRCTAPASRRRSVRTRTWGPSLAFASIRSGPQRTGRLNCCSLRAQSCSVLTVYLRSRPHSCICPLCKQLLSERSRLSRRWRWWRAARRSSPTFCTTAQKEDLQPNGSHGW